MPTANALNRGSWLHRSPRSGYVPLAMRLRARPLAAALAVTIALSVAAVALAAGAPSATTNPATAIGDTSATLNGTVFPNQRATTYYFEYGTTTAYGTQTPTEGPQGGNAGKDATATITGLTPNTTYHYRLVANNMDGSAFGSDVSFTTGAPGTTPPPGGGNQPPPAPQNTMTMTATPAAVTFGKPVAIAGQVNGPGNANVEVILEENPFPFTGQFRNTPVTTRTNATGGYTMAVTPSLNTRYRATVKTTPPITGPEANVTVRPKVTLGLSDSTPRRGQRVRFRGTVTPAHDGKTLEIQRRIRKGVWRTVARVTLATGTPLNGVARSKFARRVRISRSGVYRARITPGDGDHDVGTSRRRRARVH